MNQLHFAMFAEMTMPQLVFLAGLAILIMILSVRGRRYFSRRARESRTVAHKPHAPHLATAHLNNPTEMQRWEVEMEELARELQARLDSKMVVLQQLIRDADEATARLQTALDTAEPATLQITATRTERAARRAVPATDHPTDAFHGAYAPATGDEDPRYRDIYAMADQGLSREAIARRIGSPLGEVDLILSLRAKQ